MSPTLRTPAILLASLCLSVPAFAQHRGGRSSGTGQATAPHAVPRASIAHSPAPARGTFRAPTFGRSSVIYAQSRGGNGGHVSGGSRGTAVVRPVYRGGYGGRYYGGRTVYVAPIRYYSPYYAFRPRFSIGFGLWVGYPVAFSSSFYYGYPYYYDPYYAPYPYYRSPYPYYPPPPPAYGYPSPYSMNTYPSYGYPTQAYPSQPYQPQTAYPEQTASQPQQSTAAAEPGTAAGGISFDINPSTAAVIIDGTYVGRVSDLGPTTQPMGLKPGRHRVEIRAAGYETMTFEADIVAGQVLPYKGDMQPIR